MAKEKVKEWEITAKFHFDANLTIEAQTEAEAYKYARQFMQKQCRDMISDKENIQLKVEEVHTITPDERVKLEEEGVIEPVVKKERKKREVKEKKEVKVETKVEPKKRGRKPKAK